MLPLTVSEIQRSHSRENYTTSPNCQLGVCASPKPSETSIMGTINVKRKCPENNLEVVVSSSQIASATPGQMGKSQDDAYLLLAIKTEPTHNVSPCKEDKQSSSGGKESRNATESMELHSNESSDMWRKLSSPALLPNMESRDSRKLPKEPKSTQSVFGTGSWTLDAFTALPFQDADHEADVILSNPGSDTRTCAGGHGGGAWAGSSHQHSSFGSNNLWNQPSNNNGNHQKRPSDDGAGSGGSGDGFEPPETPKRPTKKNKQRDASGVKYACPYAKHEPGYFRTSIENGDRFMYCTFGMGFESVARVKWVTSIARTLLS